MSIYRDLILKRESRQSQKQDKLPFKRAVLVDQYGNQTSTNPMDDVWASAAERRVWYMVDGGTIPAQILCRKVSDPYVGLGVIIGYADNSQQIEVLSDDFFLTQTGDPTGWASTSPRDLEPGGIKQVWIYTKVITPLMTYPSAGLTVNVTAGDYPYGGTRKTFNGYLGFILVAPGTPGEHRLAGLYLDSANTLQVVYGTAVVVATTAPEPAWPTGAFELSAVLIENGQTTIDFDTDIFDRRLAWSDENSSGGAWPLPGKVKIGVLEYTTLALAAAAVATGELIKIGEGAFSVTTALTLDSFPLDIFGSGIDITDITTTDAAGAALYGQGTIKDLSIASAVANGSTIQVSRLGACLLYDCRFVASGTGTIKTLDIQGNATILDCFISATGATNNYGIYTDSDVTVYGGEIVGDVFVDAGATLRLVGVKWSGAKSGTGTLVIDDLAIHSATSKTTPVDADELPLVDSAASFVMKKLTWANLKTTLTVDNYPNKVKNTSGAAANAGEVGYVTWTTGSGIEYKTTTTASDNRIGSVAVVIIGGANNADIYVMDFGRHTIPYAGGAPAAGNYLVYSTTAGKLAAQTTMSPDVCAVAMAAGSGGNVDALMLARTTFIDTSTTNDIFRCDNASASDFVGTIATLPGGAVLTYNITSGNENTLDAAATTQLAKIVLYNTTRGTSALISDTVTGTNTITLTANVPAGWTVGDTITPRGAVTGTFSSAYFYDLEIADTTVIPQLARNLTLYTYFTDSGGAGQGISTHPYIPGAYSAPRLRGAGNAATGQAGINTFPRDLISRKFSILWSASGAGTANLILRLAGIEVASP